MGGVSRNGSRLRTGTQSSLTQDKLPVWPWERHLTPLWHDFFISKERDLIKPRRTDRLHHWCQLHSLKVAPERACALCRECPVTGSSLELEWARDAWVQIPDPPFSKCVILENCPKFFEITFYLLNRSHEAFLHRIDGDLIETAWKNLSTRARHNICVQ